jgi:aryl-alcohol dehydrogenase-like predicted oxidoreductase
LGGDLPDRDTALAVLRRAVEANLRTLGVDRLDVVNLRMGDLDRAATPIEEPLTALLALRDEGLIRHLGVSNVTEEEFARARAVAPLACVQNQYNVARRDDDALRDGAAGGAGRRGPGPARVGQLADHRCIPA